MTADPPLRRPLGERPRTRQARERKRVEPPRPGFSYTGQRRFALVRADAAPVELLMERSFVFGRSSKADMVIASHAVSRQHAEIFWRGWEAWVKDCGSQSGTRVNDAPISEHKLQDGDTISVGPYTCSYRCIGQGEGFLPLDLQGKSVVMAGLVAGPLSGKVEDKDMSDVLAALERKEKTGTLRVGRGDEQGVLVVREGRATFAKTDAAEGDEAIRALLRWTTGTLSFLPLIDEEATNVQSSLGQLVEEAGRRAHRERTLEQI